MLVDFACFCHLWILVVENLLFKKTKQKNPQQLENYIRCQTVWIQVRPDIMSGLIWVQAVFEGYHEMTKVATSRERVDHPDGLLLSI